MASIQARKTRGGRITYRVQVRLRGYPAQSASFERETDAKRWAARTEHAIREGADLPVNETKRHTLAELVGRYLGEVKRRKSHAFPKQRQIMTWWKRQLGGYALSRVIPALIAQKRDELLAENIGSKEAPKRRSPATANRYLAALSKAMSDAVRKWHWLHENPLHRVAKDPEPAGRVRCLSVEERRRLLDACRASSAPALELIVLLAVSTGMRRGEILGLRWPDVNLKNRTLVLQIRKKQQHRAVPLAPELAQMLLAHFKLRRLDTELVFPGTSKDRALEIDRAFRAALVTARIENFRFHDLRRTAASDLASSGATPAQIAAALGYKTLAMVRRYAHLSDTHAGGVGDRTARQYPGGAAA